MDSNDIQVRTSCGRRDMMIALVEQEPPLYTLSPLRKIGRLLLEMFKLSFRRES